MALTTVPQSQLSGILPKNYFSLTNVTPDFESGTTGWALGTIGTLTNALPTGTPTFGSGAAGTLSFATSTSASFLISGTQSGSLVSTNATTPAGNMLHTTSMLIDPSDRAKVLSYKFNYLFANAANVNLSGTSSNTFAVAVYDETNSSWIPVVGAFNIVQSSGVGTASGTLQTNSNTASLRFCFYMANAATGIYSLGVDDFFLGQQSISSGAAMTSWKDYTPTVTYNSGSATNVTHYGRWRQVGDTYEVEVSSKFSGASAAFSRPIYSLPAGAVMDAAKMLPSGVGAFSDQLIGTSRANRTGFDAYFGAASALTTTTFYPHALNAAGTYASYQEISSTVPFTAAAGDSINTIIRVPIVGKDSNVQQSSDSDQRAIALQAFKNTGSVVSGSITDVTGWNAGPLDNAGAFNISTGVYTIPTSGKWIIDGKISFPNNGTGGRVHVIYKNNVSIGESTIINSFAVDRAVTVSHVVADCVAGDQIKLGAFQSSGGTLAYDTTNSYSSSFSITKMSGSAVVQATETVACEYGLTTAQAVTVDTPIKYDTLISDSHNMYSVSTGLVTIPVSGRFRISTMGNTTTSQCSLYVRRTRGGSNSSISYVGSGQTAFVAGGSVTIPLLAGDQIAICPDSSQTFSAITGARGFVNIVSIERVGN